MVVCLLFLLLLVFVCCGFGILFVCLDQLSQGGDLNEIRLLEEERAWLVRARREVEAQAKRMLMQGLELMVGVAAVWVGLGDLVDC